MFKPILLSLFTVLGPHILCAAEPAPPITAAAFAPHFKHFVVGSQSGVFVYAWPQLKQQEKIETKLQHVHHLAFSPDKKILCMVGGAPAEQGAVEIVDWESRKLTRREVVAEEVLYGADWQPEGKLALAAGDGRVLVGGGQKQAWKELAGHAHGVLAVAWLADGKTLVSAGLDQSLRVWDVATGQPLRSLTNHTAPVLGLAVRPGDDQPRPMVASISSDRTVRLWQPTIGRMVRFLRLDRQPLSLAWNDRGTQLAIGCTDGHVLSIDPDTLAILWDRPTLPGYVYTLLPAPGSEFLAAGLHGQLARIPSKNK